MPFTPTDKIIIGRIDDQIIKKHYLARSRREKKSQRLCGIKNMMDRNFLLVYTAAKMPSKAF